MFSLFMGVVFGLLLFSTVFLFWLFSSQEGQIYLKIRQCYVISRQCVRDQDGSPYYHYPSGLSERFKQESEFLQEAARLRREKYLQNSLFSVLCRYEYLHGERVKTFDVTFGGSDEVVSLGVIRL